MKNITSKKNYILVALVFASSCFIGANTASASTLSFSVSHTDSSSTTSAFQVSLNTGGQNINVIEGALSFLNANGSPIEVIMISTAGSALTLWPNLPSYDSKTGIITFVGGVPKGTSSSKIEMFTVFAKEQPSNVRVKFLKSTAYVNDGAGTEISIAENEQSVSLGKTNSTDTSPLEKMILEDRNPPEKFNIELSRDPNTFDGKYFISFTTVDSGSGVNRYEIIEGTRPAVRSGSPYVLQNQDRLEKIEVRAFDNAGNVRVSYLDESPADKETIGNKPAISIAIVLIIIVAAYFAFKKRK